MAITRLISGSKEWSEGKYQDPAVQYEVTYEGAVLQTFERNGYDDSDFYAIVWDEAEGRTKSVCYATTRGWTYADGAAVDATDEVRAKAQVWKREQAIGSAVADAAARARLPGVGKEVRILPTATGRDRRRKGQVLPQGSTGFVAAVVVDSYRTPPQWGYSRGTVYHNVALQYEGSMIYLPLDAVEVVNPERYEVTREQVEARFPGPEQFNNFHTAAPGYVNMVSV